MSRTGRRSLAELLAISAGLIATIVFLERPGSRQSRAGKGKWAALQDHEQSNRLSNDTDRPPQPRPLSPESNAPRSETRGLTGWPRMLAIFTGALALFTGALVIAAVLQFLTMRSQLNEMQAARGSSDQSMSDQLSVMKGQLDQMPAAQRALG